MIHIVQHLVASGASLGLGGSSRFYVENRRLQRNLERVLADPVLTSAALSGVIADHRVIETMVKADDMVRNIIIQVETNLGRKLGRERAQKLLAQYAKVRAARLQSAAVVRKPYKSIPAYAA